MPPCAKPGGPWWSCLTKNLPRAAPSPAGSSSSCKPNRLAWPQPKQRSWCLSSSARGSATRAQLPQHEMQDPAAAVVEPLVGGVDPHRGVELHWVTVLRRGGDPQRLRSLLQRGEVEPLAPAEPEGRHRLA